MSFCKTNELINEGDTAVIYLSFNQLYPIKVTKGLSHHTKYGSLKHADLIGKKYGTRIKCSKGCVYALQGSPEIWTISLPHRTQIIYTPNISVITLQLELKPGSIVVESGTGSASLSHALIRTIFPTGHLHTFEFHLQRSETARKEFSNHGLSEYATVYHRDVCNDGFNLENVADAVFLDLPSPWKALASAKKALKKEGGRICSFSPCIEQVQKTVQELTQLGFTNIFTIESLRRVLCVKKFNMANFDFDMDMRSKPEDNEKVTIEKEKVESELSIATNPSADEESLKRKESNSQEDKNSKKKKNFRNKQKDFDENDSEGNQDESDNDNENNHLKNGLVTSLYTAKPINQQPGHTSFLTFATLLHKDYIS